MKKKRYYLHTIKGEPGGFHGEQICYAWSGLTLVKNLEQIRIEQKKSRAYRKKNGFDVPRYGYVLVYLPD